MVQGQLFIAMAMTKPATEISSEMTMENVICGKAAEIINARVMVSSILNGVLNKYTPSKACIIGTSSTVLFFTYR